MWTEWQASVIFCTDWSLICFNTTYAQEFLSQNSFKSLWATSDGFSLSSLIDHVRLHILSTMLQKKTSADI